MCQYVKNDAIKPSFLKKEMTLKKENSDLFELFALN